MHRYGAGDSVIHKLDGDREVLRLGERCHGVALDINTGLALAVVTARAEVRVAVHFCTWADSIAAILR